VFSVKNRVPAITLETESRLWEYLGGTVRGIGGTPIQIGGVEDHVHLLVTLRQDAALSDVMRDIKAGSSGWVHDTFPELRDFWWQGGYGAFTVSHSNLDRVKAYVANQKEHHKKMSFRDELRRLLEKHGVAFKEEYLL
jgi:REP element-mobilizing transposase RayT